VSDNFSESELEKAAFEWLGGLGHAVIYDAEIAPGEAKAERDDYHEILLARRVREALERLNPNLPPDLLEEVFQKLTRIESPPLVQNNRAFHRILTDNVTVEQRREDSAISGV
jgi:type I restriction enzyme, R subunit